MVWGPAWNDDVLRDDVPVARAQRDLCAFAETVGNDLAADLRAAEERTVNWTNAQLTAALVDVAVSRAMRRLAETGVWGRDNEIPSRCFWAPVADWLSTSALVHRARFKPRGLAGDHEMLAAICEGHLCEHPLGRHLDRYFLNQAAPQAVRARTEQIAALLAAAIVWNAKPARRVVSIGSGPALDVLWALQSVDETTRRYVEVGLLDLDEEGLAAACQRLNTLLPADHVVAKRENLVRLPRIARVQPLIAGADFIVVSGLFDYLVDDNAQTMLAFLWDSLAAGGTLVVGNFAPHCATRALMEWVGNWYLIYRRKSEMHQLAKSAGIPDESARVGAERTGTDLFLVATK